MKLGRLSLILASAAAFGLPPTTAHAGTFSVSPLRVELSGGTQTGSLTLRNQESEPVVVQAEAMLWTQVDGQDQLAATRDLLVSPAVFTIPANGSQLVRVALRRPADPRQELSYRLLLTEVPQQASPDFTGLNVALRISLPAFVAPDVAVEPKLEWSARRTPEGSILLTARNAGNTHARTLGFSVATATGEELAIEQNATAYVLPGQARTWTVKNNQKSSTSSIDVQGLRVKGSTEAGDFDVEARLDEP